MLPGAALPPRPARLSLPSGVLAQVAEPTLQRVVQSPVVVAPAGATHGEITERALKAVLGSAEPLAFDQVRAKLKISRDALAPVLEQLVEHGKVRMLEVDGKIKYKPPRIEPIKRVRPKVTA